MPAAGEAGVPVAAAGNITKGITTKQAMRVCKGKGEA